MLVIIESVPIIFFLFSNSSIFVSCSCPSPNRGKFSPPRFCRSLTVALAGVYLDIEHLKHISYLHLPRKLHLNPIAPSKMPLDTIYTTRHGVRAFPYLPNPSPIPNLYPSSRPNLTTAAPSKLDNRLPHRALHVLLPNTNRESSGPIPNLARSKPIARTRRPRLIPGFPPEVLQGIFESVL